MLSYILKRIALMLPTLLGVLTVAFVVIQFVPGGPVEQILAQARIGAGGAYKARGDVDAKQVEALKKLYGFDKPALVRYCRDAEELLRPSTSARASTRTSRSGR